MIKIKNENWFNELILISGVSTVVALWLAATAAEGDDARNDAQGNEKEAHDPSTT